MTTYGLHLAHLCTWTTFMVVMATRIAAGQDSNVTVLEQLVALMGTRGDLRLPPSVNKIMNVPVDVAVFVNSIGELDEMNMDFTVNIYLRQLWVDPRLSWKDDINHTGSISVPDPFFVDVWKPDTFIENGKEEKVHLVTQENHSFRVYGNGKIFYSQRLSLKLWCMVDLKNFPHDNQTCHVNMMSYRYIQQEMKLSWLAGKPIENFDTIKLARFTLTNVSKGDCTTGYSTDAKPDVEGSYSCVFLEFHFAREFGYYALQIYVPSALIVVLSWVSFFLDPLAVPGRISLGVLTILTMSTQMASAATSALPKVSYIKAIDIWLTTCMLFLFMALVEFALVNSLARRDISKANKVSPDEDEPMFKVFVHKVLFLKQQSRLAAAAQATNGGACSSGENASENPETFEVLNTAEKACIQCDRSTLSASALDISSRIIFPILFFIFNLLYWLIYTFHIIKV